MLRYWTPSRNDRRTHHLILRGTTPISVGARSPAERAGKEVTML